MSLNEQLTCLLYRKIYVFINNITFTTNTVLYCVFWGSLNKVFQDVCKTQTHVHVVYPVSTDGSSVVAEVVLDCRNSHLTEKNKATIKKWMTTYCFIQCTVWQCVCVIETAQQTFSSSKRRVKWRISANCLASACSLSRC